MAELRVDELRRLMDVQLARQDYPSEFPALPDIPVGRYADPGFAATEQRQVWRKSWLIAGLANSLAEPGSYFLFEEVGASVIVSRGKDGKIRAFHNVCRHRGSALVREPRGKLNRFICPYHAWAYGLDGALLAVPEAQDFSGLDKSQRHLASVRCEVWRGIVFLNLDPDASSFDDFVAPLEEHSAGFPLESIVERDAFSAEVDCNWKIALHNFTEGYHTNVVHRKTLANYLEPRTFLVSLLKGGHARIAVNKRNGASIYMEGQGGALDGIDEAFIRYTISLFVFPNSFIALDPGGFTILTFWPRSVDGARLHGRIVGIESMQADDGYWAAFREANDTILAEDVELFAGLQRGVRSGAIQSIVFGYQERTLYWFEEEIDRRIGALQLPADLAVTPVLAGQVGRS